MEKAGFRPSKYCYDQINTQRIIVEQLAEFRFQLYLVLVDQRYSRTRSKWSILREIGASVKIINSLQDLDYADDICLLSHSLSDKK